MERTDLPPYEEYSGPVDSPRKYVDFCVHQGRRQGKTHKLIMSIPNKPIVIVVWQLAYGKELAKKIQELRPDYDIKNIKFVRYDEANGPEMRGLNRPIYVDNAVLDMVQYEFVDKMNKLYGERANGNKTATT